MTWTTNDAGLFIQEYGVHGNNSTNLKLKRMKNRIVGGAWVA